MNLSTLLLRRRMMMEAGGGIVLTPSSVIKQNSLPIVDNDIVFTANIGMRVVFKTHYYRFSDMFNFFGEDGFKHGTYSMRLDYYYRSSWDGDGWWSIPSRIANGDFAATDINYKNSRIIQDYANGTSTGLQYLKAAQIGSGNSTRLLWMTGSNNENSISIKSFEITDGTEVIRDCVAAYDNNTRLYGFIDNITGKFYGNESFGLGD